MQAIADAEAKANKTPKITIEPWDYRFYAEKGRKAKYDLDESEVKPYLQLDKLTQGMFWAAGQLYDLGFKENTGTIPVFDPKVRTFEVYNLKTNENVRSEEHTSELQSLMRISYAVFCLKKKIIR